MKKLYNIDRKFKKRLSLPLIMLMLTLSLLQGCGNTLEEKPLLPAVPSEDIDIEETLQSSEPEAVDFDTENSIFEQVEETAVPAPPTAVLETPSTMKLHINGTQLTDSEGNAVQLKGISTHGLAWFPDYVNEDCFHQLKDEWNANVIRLAMYTAEYGGYCTGGDQTHLKELIKNGVEYATASDMYVIIDWHILSDNNPNIYKEEAKIFFAEMAELYADYDNVLYEICNEPNGGTSWNDIKSYAEEVIPVIRSYDKEGIIIVGTPNWSQYVDQAAADPITGYDNIMYALHFYAATHTDSLRNTMVSALNAGLPVFVSEYGICDASGNGSIDENQASQWINLMDKYGVSYVAWNLSNKNETSAILSNSCSKTSGFTENDLSSSGKWLYQMLTGKNSDTLVETDTASDNTQNADNTLNNNSIQTNSATQNVSSVESSILFSDSALSFAADLINSWESEGRTFYQYDLTISNTSDADCSQWAVDISFSDAITLSNSWNGNFSANGKTVHITCKDYNGIIPAGGSTGNIGFIISSGGDLKIIT